MAKQNGSGSAPKSTGKSSASAQVVAETPAAAPPQPAPIAPATPPAAMPTKKAPAAKAKKPAAPKKPAKKAKTAKKAVAKPTKASPTKLSAAKPSPTKPTVKKGGKTAAATGRAQPKLDENALRQRKVRAKVMKGRIAKSGLTSKIAGHISARGRRQQARRDAKSAGEG